MITYKTLFLELIIFIYVCYRSSGVTILPSETIDVIEGSDFMFQLKDDNETNFCSCDYKSNLDNSWTTFPIDKPYNACLDVTTTTVKPITPKSVLFLEKLPRASENNKVVDSGGVGSCRVNVKKVNDQVPLEWSLKPFDKNDTYHEQVDFKVNFFYAAPLLLNEIVIYEGEDFFQYMNSSIIFESCSVTYNGITRTLNLKEEEEAVILKTDRKIDQEQLDTIYSLGRGLCGFRLTNAGPTENFEWTLTGVANDKKKYRAIFLAKIFPNIADSTLHLETVVQVGDSPSINCKNDYPKETIHYCEVYNPQRNLVLRKEKVTNTDCSYQINPFQVDDYGIWKCFTGNSKTMKSIERTVKFVEKESAYMSTWVREEKDYLSVGCQLLNSDARKLDYCKLTSPHQQIFSLKPGSATERYIAFGTDFEKLRCEMQIKMPLRNNETGMWRCETDLGGAFINVRSQAVVDFQKYSKLTARLGKQLLISCQIPYYSNFCYIKSPNGTRYIPETQEQAWLGRCSLEIKAVDVSDNGTWTCSFAQTNGMPDDEISVEVTIAEVLSYDPEVKATEDYPVTMLCNSGGLALQYCQFIDPSGKSYFIDNKVNSSYLSYHGKGIEYGECGIKIASATKPDAGTWSCVIRIVKESKEISARISVEVSPNLLSGSNLVLALGLTVGIVAISSLFMIIGIRTIRQRRRGRLEIAQNQSLRDIHNDEAEDIFSVGVPPRSYDNPQIVRDDDHQHQY